MAKSIKIIEARNYRIAMKKARKEVPKKYVVDWVSLAGKNNRGMSTWRVWGHKRKR